MELHGLLVCAAYGEVPPRVEYSLTPRGEQLLFALADLGAWGEEHFGHSVEPVPAAGRSAG